MGALPSFTFLPRHLQRGRPPCFGSPLRGRPFFICNTLCNTLCPAKSVRTPSFLSDTRQICPTTQTPKPQVKGKTLPLAGPIPLYNIWCGRWDLNPSTDYPLCLLRCRVYRCIFIRNTFYNTLLGDKSHENHFKSSLNLHEMTLAASSISPSTSCPYVPSVSIDPE